MDLLRIVATLFVIILHYNNTGSGKAFLYTAELGINFQILLFLEVLSICAVNVFVLITGYFQSAATQVSLAKPVTLFLELTILSVFRFAAGCVLGFDTFSFPAFLQCLIPTNWYIAVYLALYLISPYINIALKHLTAAQHRTLLVVLFCIFSVWAYLLDLLADLTAFSVASPISAEGSADGYTLVNFIFLYVLGAYLRNSKQDMTVKYILPVSGAVYLATTAAIFLQSRVLFATALSYCSPLVIVQSTALFVFFCSLNIKCRFVSRIAKTSFGVYLLHSFFYPFIQVKAQVTGKPILIPFYAALSSIIIYLAASLVYQAYRLTLGRIVQRIAKNFHSISYGI